MRNLHLIDHRHHAFAGPVPRDAVLCVDPVTHEAYMVHREGVRCLTESSSSPAPLLWAEHGLKTAGIVAAECITMASSGAAAICVASQEGDLIVVTPQEGEVEVMGSVPDGISAASWSPDQEILALVTSSANLILMSAMFDDPLVETQLSEANPTQSQVALGWGKKETQFHGSEGKGAALQGKPVPQKRLDWDSGHSRITWRGDGELFAVSFVPSTSGVRRVAVLNTQGEVQALSEDLDPMEATLAWRPSGGNAGAITTTQVSSHKHQVAFLEKNGLKHGGFTLPFPPKAMEVVQVAWSPDGTVLAVWGRPLEQAVGEGKGGALEEVVQLWTCANYHWYMKREMRFGGGGGKEGTEGESKGKDGKVEGENEEKEKREGGTDGKAAGESVGKEGETGVEGEGVEAVLGVCWGGGGAGSPSPLLLHLLTTHQHHRLAWLSAPHTSPGHGSSDLATAAVVDGAALLLTPFRLATVPPPMAALKATFPQAVNGLCWCLGEGGAPEGDVDDSGFLDVAEEATPGQATWDNAVCVQHGPNTLTVLAPGPAPAQDSPTKAKDAPAPGQVAPAPASHGCVVEATGLCGAAVQPWSVLGQVRVEWPEHIQPRPTTASELYHWAWPVKDTLVAVFSSGATCCLALLDLLLEGEGGQAVARQVVVLEDCVVAVAASATLLALQLASGSVVKVDVATGAMEPFLVEEGEVELPGPCQRLCLATMEGEAAPLPLALTQRGRLYLGHRQLLADCTSVCVHGQHLLATTATHTLLAVPLTTQGLASLGQAGAGAGTQSGARRVERGARLVVAVGGACRVVLQLPRGNLEEVCPRPLVLAAVTRLLAGHQYGAALATARRHRLDTNLLYDHNPGHFLAAAQAFVTDVADPHHLDQFLAALSEANTTATTYAFHYPGRPAAPAPQGGKVAAVCEALRAAMEAVDGERFRLPVLTALAKAGQMEAALARVGARRGRQGPGGAEEGLRHLLYLADTEQLYRVALGTYDLALALLVAQHSQRDPKEFLPQLQGLQDLEEDLRRCRIDVLLGRHRRAIRGLAASTTHRQELLALVEGQGLHSLALQELPASSEAKATVCESYARVLAGVGRPGEAAIMWERAGQHEAALEAYRQAGEWRMALVAAARLGLAKEHMVELCHGLAQDLRGRGRHAEAAALYEQHLGAEEEAVACLAAAGAWQDGLRLAHKHSRPDLIETNILPVLLQAAVATQADLRELADTLASQAARLATVRQAGVQRAAAGPGVALDEAPLDCDLYSDTSTISGHGSRPGPPRRPGSTATTRSQTSSRSRRKAARKKYSTKPGSPHEDLGLVAALHLHYTTLATHAQAMAPLTAALVTLGHDAQAAALQAQFSALLKLAEAKKAEIWPPLGPVDQPDVEFGPDMTTEAAVRQLQAGQGGEGAYLAQRMALLDPHLRHPPPTPGDTWKLGLLHTSYTGE